jgi:hypothetical protein
VEAEGLPGLVRRGSGFGPDLAAPRPWAALGMTRDSRLVPDAMRSMLAFLLAVSPAYAQAPPAPAPAPVPAPVPVPAPKAAPAPAPNRRPPAPPPASLQDVTPRSDKPTGNGTGGLSLDGGFSSSTVILPPLHPDARPWPRGMVMQPPEGYDDMAIAPGTDALPSADRPTWASRLADALHSRLDALLDLVLPRML